MKAKKFNLIPATLLVTVCFLINLLLLFAGPGRAGAAVSDLQEQALQLLGQEYAKNGVINSDAGVGAHAVYILNQAGVDPGAWKHNGASLKDEVIAAVKDDISKADNVPAKRLAQDLAAVKVLGQTSLADQLILILKDKQGEKGFEDTGPLSIYSNVPAFELLSRVGLINQIDVGQAREYILGKQYTGVNDAQYGSWGSSEDDRYYADFMATTAAVRFLHRLDPAKSDIQIQKAISDGLAWVKNQQKAGGNFMAGMDDTLVDTCEVVVTLKTLGMDPGAWQGSEGENAVFYIINNAINPDGSLGPSQNVMNATWVLWACQVLNGKTSVTPPAPSIPVQPGVGEFKDIKGHWAENTIYGLAGQGIISGYPDGAFKPENKVTRNEIASMMARLLKPAGVSKHDSQMAVEKFIDAGDIAQWALEDIATAVREGLISGYPQPDGTFSFEGDRQVSRAELSVILARIIEKKCGQVTPKILDFADTGKIPEWAGGAIGTVYAKGIAGGYPDHTFQAGNPVSRAEAASMILRLSDLLRDR